MMKVLIIEDEVQAAQHLERLLNVLEPNLQVLDKLDTVKRSVQWLKSNPPPDVIFMDIQLADGISFSIFEQTNVTVPVIFTTAYDAYALKAFKVNSVDYILKPVDETELALALKKFKTLMGNSNTSQAILNNIQDAVKLLTRKYKSRFVVKVGEHLRTIETETIQYFYSQEKATFCVTADGRNHILDFTLEQLEDMTDPDVFFRINRKYLIAAKSVSDIISYTNSRLKLVIGTSSDNDIIVARERVQDFKKWLDR
jgi:DNA-binding LytR/AlgR family response regulator